MPIQNIITRQVFLYAMSFRLNNVKVITSSIEIRLMLYIYINQIKR